MDNVSPYFDVSTADIITRLIWASFPFNGKFHSEYNRKPDIYGPIWILLTLIVAITVATNFSRYLVSSGNFTYQLTVFPIALGCLFSICLGLPLAIYYFVKCFGDRESTVTLVYGIGMYCYSFTAFLLSTLICGFVTNSAVRWVLLAYSTFTSVLFLINVYWIDL